MVKTVTRSVIIKCTLAKPAAAEWANELQYFYQINPMFQDAQGNDRVFTTTTYTLTENRNTPKHSHERKHIAKLLRSRHAYVWNLYKQSMLLDS